MSSSGPAPGVRSGLLARVLARLGFARPPGVDLDGLRAIYAAWCAKVPFDNVRKMIALREGGEPLLPGGDAEDFFEHFLADGTGGTCWPTSNALFALLAALGFDARRVAGSMRDTGVVSHGSVKVRVGADDWLVDSSMLTNVPLPLEQRLIIREAPVFAFEVEPVDGTHVVWVDMPPSPEYLPCRLLVDPADDDLYAERYEASRQRSPFNQRLYARRNRPGEYLLLYGNTRLSKTATGTVSEALPADSLCRALRDEIGFSDALIERWVRCGALADSLQPVDVPPPPPNARRRPSLR